MSKIINKLNWNQRKKVKMQKLKIKNNLKILSKRKKYKIINLKLKISYKIINQWTAKNQTFQVMKKKRLNRIITMNWLKSLDTRIANKYIIVLIKKTNYQNTNQKADLLIVLKKPNMILINVIQSQNFQEHYLIQSKQKYLCKFFKKL